jgi:antirestriction protein ArdC
MEYHNNSNSDGSAAVHATSRSKNRKPASAQQLIRDNVQYLIEQLEAGHSESLTAFLDAMAHFHSYSFGNVLLIARQKPDATRVAGMFTWNQLGRRVKRGEKGIAILAPMIGKRRKKQSVDTGTEEEANKSALLGFRRVFVWSETQTEGAPLPSIGQVTGDASVYLDRLRNFVQAQGVTVELTDEIAPAMGTAFGTTIRLLPGQTEAEELATLVHEYAHLSLGHCARRTTTTKTVRETEAEAVAFVVAKAVGLNPASSASYIQLYDGNAELLMESLEVVQQTSAVILAAIKMEEPIPPDAEEPQSATDASPDNREASYSPAPAEIAEAAQPAA